MDYTKNFQERYSKLNDQQKRAVDCTQGPVLVIAGPGSGKTEILSLSVANKLLTTDTLPSSILCLTFTDAAAANMRQRLANIIGSEAYKVAIHTFHSFGTEIINQNPEYFYQGANYSAADQLIQIQILEEVLEGFDHTNSLNSFHPSQGYTYLREILTKISELKRGGLNPEEFKSIINQNTKFIEKFNPLIDIAFRDRISKKIFGKITNLLNQLQQLESSGLQIVLRESLEDSLKQAQLSASTKPITAWKKQYTSKDKDGKTVLKDHANLDKHHELAKAYSKYQELLHQKGYFDFSDMILDVIKQAQNNPELKFNLQERYQYVLVDEFQDTSGAQMKFLDILLDAEVNEGRPNILAVGDDDQSVFKFQGANIDNIMSFHQKYREPEIVVLTNNYRSTQEILNLARSVITQSDERLENKLPEITKVLKASREDISGSIIDQDFPTNLHEYSWIASQIKEMLEQGQNPSEIAVIAPKHRILQEIAKTLDFYQIPINYKQQKDLLAEKHIHEIIQMAKFVNSISSAKMSQADEYLPEILAFDFWEIGKVDIWKISLEANRNRCNWLEVMHQYPNDKIQNIANFFIELAGLKKQITAEEILDILTGSKELEVYTSPFKNFYFNEKRQGYIELLSGLESFFTLIRNYHSRAGIYLEDLLEFITLNEKHQIKIAQSTLDTGSPTGINLLTAHRSKGLEFETVFIASCQEDIWIKRYNFNKLKLPSNLNLSPEVETIDDQLRLFYVALTRAKKNIYISHHQYLDNGRAQAKVRFLKDPELEKKQAGGVMPQKIKEMKDEHARQHKLQELTEANIKISKHKITKSSDQEILKERVKDYKLSITHLNNFLNLVNAGPQYFLEHNLLRFPHRQSPASAYGSAVHNALNHLQQEFKIQQKKPPEDFLVKSFDSNLKMMRLNERDHQSLQKKGHDQLRRYYQDRIDSFDPKDYSEYNFDRQSVVIGSAQITGKIDKMRIKEKEIQVLDYKTGKPLRKWDSGQEYEKLKSWQYKNQLIFYKLLVENARDFQGNYRVSQGSLEFVEAKDPNSRFLHLDISEVDSQKMSKLVAKVYEKIINLDFPDTSDYEKNLYGVYCFTEDLLAGRI